MAGRSAGHPRRAARKTWMAVTSTAMTWRETRSIAVLDPGGSGSEHARHRLLRQLALIERDRQIEIGLVARSAARWVGSAAIAVLQQCHKSVERRIAGSHQPGRVAVARAQQGQ